MREVGELNAKTERGLGGKRGPSLGTHELALLHQQSGGSLKVFGFLGYLCITELWWASYLI